MGLFDKLIALQPLQPYLQMEDVDFIEEIGWREVLHKIKEFKRTEIVSKIIHEAAPKTEREKIVLGYVCTIGAESADGPIELPCVDYAGCYMDRGILKLTNPGAGVRPNYVGMGMNVSDPEAGITIDGNVGDYLGYRSLRIRIELNGSAKDMAGMALGEGALKIHGDVESGLGGDAHHARLEIMGSVGRINGNNSGCTMLIGGDVHEGIGSDQAKCFIKICGSVGKQRRKTGKVVEIAEGLSKDSALLVGGDVYGHIGKGMALAKILVWGRVHGKIQASDTDGGFIYLNKKSVPLFTRVKNLAASNIGIKYVSLAESGYLQAEKPEHVKDMILR